MHDRARAEERILETLRRRNIGMRRALSRTITPIPTLPSTARGAFSTPVVISASSAPTGMKTTSGRSPAASFF